MVQRLRLLTVPAPVQLSLQIALLTGVYVLIALVGLRFAVAPSFVSPVWPLAGVIFVALFQGGLRLWPGVLLGELLTGLSLGMSPGLALGIAGVTTLEVVLTVILLRPRVGSSLELDSLREVLAFMLITMLISVPIAASGAALLFTLNEGAGWLYAWQVWRAWWIGDTMGVLTVAPALITLRHLRVERIRWLCLLEASLLCGMLVLVTTLVMRDRLNYAYLLFIFVIWAAIRFGPRGTALVMGGIALLTTWLTALGQGPFVVALPDDSLFFLQSFLAVMVVTGLTMSALVAERMRRARAAQLLADSSELLLHHRDEAQLLQAIAERAARWADGCWIDRLERDGSLNQVAVASRDPALHTQLARFSGLSAPLDEPYRLAQVIQQRQGQIVPGGDCSVLVHQLAPAGVRHQLWTRVQPRALMLVPLLANNQPLGGVVFFSTSPTRVYQPDDLVWAQDLAERVAQTMLTTRMAADLTRMQRLEALEQLANGVAHDFNNLLTVIMGHSQLAYESVTLEHPVRADLEAILQTTERAQVLVNELRLIGHRGAVQWQVCDLNLVVQQADMLLRPLVGATIEVQYLLAAEPVRCTTNPAQLERVLVNLVTNARDAMPQGGRLTIRTCKAEPHSANGSATEPGPGRYVQLHVKDTGSGIAPELLNRIFEPYFTTKPFEQGSGLGLAISYGIVRQLGGQITVQSTPGQGTEFVIMLPQDQPCE